MGCQAAKIGINKGDNPYMVASNFIDDHDLNPDYLETIARCVPLD